MDHKHLYVWKRYRVIGRWANQFGRGLRTEPDGSECQCGAAITQRETQAWMAERVARRLAEKAGRPFGSLA
jgi:hypothetical protein